MTIFDVKARGLTKMNLLSLPQRKALLDVWWNYCGIIHFEFLNHNQILNVDLCSVYENLLKKHPALVNKRNVVLLS